MNKVKNGVATVQFFIMLVYIWFMLLGMLGTEKLKRWWDNRSP